jgi:hypothetical protein
MREGNSKARAGTSRRSGFQIDHPINEHGPRRRGTTTYQPKSVEDRLADAARGHGGRNDTRVRVNALRAREADARSRLRAGVEAADPWDGAVGRLNRNSSSTGSSMRSTSTSRSPKRNSLESAAGARLPLPYGHGSTRRSHRAGRGRPPIVDSLVPPGARHRLGRRRSVAGRPLRTTGGHQRYRDLSNGVSGSLRAAVLAALDDLDRSAAQGRSDATGDG